MNECVTVNQEARKSAAIREDGAPKLLTMGSTRVRVGGFNQGVIVGVLAGGQPAYAWVVCKRRCRRNGGTGQPAYAWVVCLITHI